MFRVMERVQEEMRWLLLLLLLMSCQERGSYSSTYQPYELSGELARPSTSSLKDQGATYVDICRTIELHDVHAPQGVKVGKQRHSRLIGR